MRRGNEQHVERKIRLWVVQQERNRLRERAAERVETSAEERRERLATQLESGARDR